MSNKRIRNRLDKLFDGIKHEDEKMPAGETQPEGVSEPPAGNAIQTPPVTASQSANTQSLAGMIPAATETMVQEADTEAPALMQMVFRTEEQNWNSLQVIDERPDRRFGEDEQLLVKQVVDQLTLALQNANLFQQTQRQANELVVLNEMGRTLVSQLNLEQIHESVYKYTSQLMNTENFFIAYYDQAKEEVQLPFIITAGRRDTEIIRKLGNGLSDHIIRTKQPVFFPDRVEERMRDIGIQTVLMSNTQVAKCWLGVPMMAGDRILGVIAVQSIKQERIYDEHHRDLLLSVASQTAIAIQNARLFQQTQQQNAELAVLNEMGRELSAQLTVDGISDVVYRYTARLMDVTNIFIAQYHPENQEMSFPLVYFDGQKTQVERQSVGNGLTAWIIRTRQPLFIPDNLDAEIERMGLQSLNVADEDSALCWLGVPMIQGNETFGVIALQSTITAHLYTERHRDLLIAIASQAAIAIQNARLFEETQTRAQELSMLNELGRVISGELDSDKILHALTERIREILPLDAFNVGLYNKDKDTLRFAVFYENGEYQPTEESPLDEYKFSAQVIRSRSPLLVLRTTAELEAEKAKRQAGQLPPSSSMIYNPVMVGSDILGVLSVQSYKLNAYGKEQVSLIENIANQLAVALQNARFFDETRKRANELATLNEIVRTVSEQIELKPVLEATYEQVRKIVPSDAFFVALYDEMNQTVSFPFMMDEGQLYEPSTVPYNPESLTGRTIASGEHIFELRTPEDLTLGTNSDPASLLGNIDKESASLVYLPLKAGTRTIGVLSVQSYAYNAYNPEDLNLLTNIANQLVVAIQNARLFEQEQYRRKVADTLSEMARIAGSTLNMDEVVPRLLSELPKLIDFHTASIQLILPDGSRRQVGGVTHDQDRLASLEAPTGIFLRPVQDDPLINEVFTKREPVIIADTYNDSRWDVMPETAQIHSWMCAPLIAAEKVIGLLILDDNNTGTYSPNVLEVVQSFTAQAAIAIQNANLFSETQEKEANFRSLVETAPEAIIVIDMETGLFADPNENAALLYGLSKEELVKVSPLQLSPEYQPDGLASEDSAREKFNQAMGGQTVIFEWYHINAKGKTIPCEIHLSRMPGKNQVRATVVDITERKLAEEALARRARQLQAVAEITSATTTILDEENLLQTLVELTQDRFGLYHAHIFMYNEKDGLLDVKACGWEPGDTHRGTHGTRTIQVSQPVSLVARAARTRQAVVANDVRSDPNWLANPVLPDIASEMAIPVIAGNELFGVLNVHSRETNFFGNEDIAIMTTLAAQVGTSIQNVRSFREAQSRARRERILREITARVRNSTDPQSILRTAVRELGDALGIKTFIRIGKPENADSATAQKPQKAKGGNE